MIHANEMTPSEVEDALEDDMEDQFDAMDYTVQCNTCGKEITDVLLSKDFNLNPVSRNMRGMGDSIVAHNMTHYKKPIVLACEDDDIFGVVHTNCNLCGYLNKV